MRAVGIAAAMESTVCSGRISVPTSPSKPLDVLRLDGDDDERRAGGCIVVRERGVDAVALAELCDALGSAARRGDLRRLAPAGRQEPGDQRLADPARAEDRDLARVDHARSVRRRRQAACSRRRAHESRPIHARAGHEPALEPLQQEDAREPLPLGVRGEELRGLARLGPASAERREELDEAEVVHEPRVVAAEPLERDDPDRPRADAALATEPRERVGSPSQPLEVDRAREPRQGRGSARCEPARGQPCGREPRERLAGSAGPHRTHG